MKADNIQQLTIFYDGHCHLCLTEMRHLKDNDVENRIVLANIHDEDFGQRYPHINPDSAYRILHGETNDGNILLGLDVTCLAWSLVGKYKWLRVLRWPIIRIFSDAMYLFFARYRNRISGLFNNKSSCLTCSIKK